MSRFSLVPLASAFAFINMVATPPVTAKTFYIDAINGNDVYSGALPDPVKGDGPWQTLANLAITNKFVSGDSILLRCGHKWAETLKLNSSGTAGAPIRIGTYPASCGTKPAIDGAKRIPASAWSLHSGKIYKVKLPVNLITNSVLDTSYSGWRKWSQNNDAQMGIAATCPDSGTACLAFTSGSVGSSLLISNPFAVETSGRYRVTFSIRAPSGVTYSAYARRFSSPWDVIGLSAPNLSGNGGWQTVTLFFTSKAELSSTRLDIQVNQPSQVVHVKDIQVSRDESGLLAELSLFTDNNAPQFLAHHPNRGFNPASPDSPYLVTPTASPTITELDGSKGSAYLVTGSDLVLPPGGSIKAGQRVVLRNQAWSMFEHTVTSVSGNQVYLDPVTASPLQFAGWGYYLTGALWMLDSPSEWHFDSTTQTLYAWPKSGQIGEGLAYSTLQSGIDIAGRQYIDIEDLTIRNVTDAIHAERVQNVALRRLDIANAARYGIYAEGGLGFELSNSQITNTGSDALIGSGLRSAVIRDNDIVNSGVMLDANGKPVNLPLPNYGAIHTADDARISGNRLRNAAYIGITAGHGSQITDNAVTGFCLLLSDCAGIYLGGVTSAVVSGNLVTGGVGDRLGTPNGLQTLVDALYLDGGSSNVVATDNTLEGGDYTIQFHDGHDNRVERNTLYGSRSHLIWLQETANDKRSTGNIYGNVFTANAMFATAAASAVRNAAKVEHTADFGTFQDNVYSAHVSPIIVVENMPTGSRSYQFADWQAATDPNGVPRYLDINGGVGAPISGFARGLLGSTMVVNGDISNGSGGWSRFNSTAPTATLVVDSCAPLASNCLLLTAGGSNTSLSTPRFDVIKGQWYRVSVDAQVGATGQTLKMQAIQSGPSNYSSVMGAEAVVFSGSTTLKRYNFVFQATSTVQRSSTSAGVRVDLMDVKPGQTLRVANFEIVPLTPSGGDNSQALLSNPERTSISATCPTAVTAPAQCSNFYLFPQGGKAIWPLTLAPLSSQIVFAQDASITDNDNDSVADTQDTCPGTPAGTASNAKGCGLGQ